MDEERKQEVAGFLRQKMVAENKRFSEFVDNMNERGYYGGSSICYGLRIGRTLSTLHKPFAPNVQRSAKTN